MTFVDPIGDMLTRIRNAQMRLLNKVKIPSSKFRSKILDVLKKEGYISDYKTLNDLNNKRIFSVDLKYNNGLPVIKKLIEFQNQGEEYMQKRVVYQKLKMV